MNLYQLHSDPRSLDLHDEAHEQVPEVIWDKYKSDPAELKKREAAIARNAWCAFLYTQNVLCKPFPAGEAAIAQDPEYAYYYARSILKGPFSAGEAAIAADKTYSHAYARSVLKLPADKAKVWGKNHLERRKINEPV